MNLFSKAVVAIDGSEFKAVNNRDKNFTAAKVEARLAQVAASIGRDLAALDRADREPSDIAEARTTRLNEKIAGLRAQMQALQAMGRQVEAAPDGQVSLTDPDARSMATSGKGTGMVGYNVQAAVDTEHHLIVAHAVTNVGGDRAQLAPMGLLAQAATGCATLTVLIARAHRIRERLMGDTSISIDEVARVEALSRSYTTRLLRLSYLAPDITARLIAGAHPPELNATRLMQDTRLPLDWAEQRTALAMA